MCGWSEQKYRYAPGRVSVTEYLSPVSSAGDLSGEPGSVPMTVCGAQSSFTQPRYLPPCTVIAAGANVKLLIEIGRSAPELAPDPSPNVVSAIARSRRCGR